MLLINFTNVEKNVIQNFDPFQINNSDKKYFLHHFLKQHYTHHIYIKETMICIYFCFWHDNCTRMKGDGFGDSTLAIGMLYKSL